MPAQIFSSIRTQLTYPLTKLINLSFQTRILPDHLRIAKITPIFKRSDKSDPSNYRPIYCLPYIGKCFERCITYRLISFCHKFSLFCNEQFSFFATDQQVINNQSNRNYQQK